MKLLYSIVIFMVWLVENGNAFFYNRRSGLGNNNSIEDDRDPDPPFLLDMFGADGFEDALDSYILNGNTAHAKHPAVKEFRKRSTANLLNSKPRGVSPEFWKSYFDITGASL